MPLKKFCRIFSSVLRNVSPFGSIQSYKFCSLLSSINHRLVEIAQAFPWPVCFNICFFRDSVQKKVGDTASGVIATHLDLPTQFCQRVESLRLDFSDYDLMQIPVITENQLATNAMICKIANHVGMNYPIFLDSSFWAQLLNLFLFPWKKENLKNHLKLILQPAFRSIEQL